MPKIRSWSPLLFSALLCINLTGLLGEKSSKPFRWMASYWTVMEQDRKEWPPALRILLRTIPFPSYVYKTLRKKCFLRVSCVRWILIAYSIGSGFLLQVNLVDSYRAFVKHFLYPGKYILHVNVFDVKCDCVWGLLSVYGAAMMKTKKNSLLR